LRITVIFGGFCLTTKLAEIVAPLPVPPEIANGLVGGVTYTPNPTTITS